MWGTWVSPLQVTTPPCYVMFCFVLSYTLLIYPSFFFYKLLFAVTFIHSISLSSSFIPPHYSIFSFTLTHLSYHFLLFPSYIFLFVFSNNSSLFLSIFQGTAGNKKTLMTAGTFALPSAQLILESITPRMAGERMNSERYVPCVLTFYR